MIINNANKINDKIEKKINFKNNNEINKQIINKYIIYMKKNEQKWNIIIIYYLLSIIIICACK